MYGDVILPRDVIERGLRGQCRYYTGLTSDLASRCGTGRSG
jgi:hypothetical protein